MALLCATAPRGRAAEAVHVAFSSQINSLDPVMTIEGLPLFRSIFDALTDTAPDGSLKPRLAEGWNTTDGGTTWIFHVRAGVHWSDGSPVTPEDVVFTMRRIMATPTSLNHNYLAALLSVDRAGARDVVFRLRRPAAAWPRQMTLISIVPQRAYQKMGQAAFAAHPVSSGPYSVIHWDRAGDLTLQANPDYWAGRPEVGTVVVVPLADSVARLNGLLAGELDVIPLGPQQVPLATGRPHVAVETVASNRVVYLGFNVRSDALRAITLRQAISAAIDRTAITRYLLRGLAAPASALVAPATFGYDPALKPVSFDPARARKLLADSGYAGQVVQFDYATDGTVALGNEVAQAIGGYLEASGIHVRLHGSDERSLIADWITRRFPGLYMFSYAPSTMDAALVTGSLLGPRGARYFSDARVDALEQGQQQQPDAGRRAQIFGTLLRLSNDMVYYAPLFSDRYAFAVRTDRVRFTPRADGYVLAQDLHHAAP